MDDAWKVMDEIGWITCLPMIADALSAVITYSGEHEDDDGADPNG